MLYKIIVPLLLLTIGLGLFFWLRPQPLVAPVVETPKPSVTETVYSDRQGGYTISYPTDWTIDPTYTNTSPNPAVPAAKGVRFGVPVTMTAGTNLSLNDTGLSVESIEEVAECSANTFTSSTITPTTTTIDGTEYSFATTSDAGAGNFYEEHIYALADSQPCTAIRYLIHSSNIANYEPGTKTEFNRPALLQKFDAMRDSLVTR